jgi:hypothetical protein
MAHPVTDDPRKRTATEAMRLKPRATATDDVSAVRGARALDELLDLHDVTVGRLCRECLVEWPCRTKQLASIIAGERDHEGET